MAAQRGPVDPLVDDGRVRVWRSQHLELGVLIHKEAIGTGALARIAHEASVLRRLDGVPGVPRLVSSLDVSGLVVAGISGRPLSEVLAERRLRALEVVVLGQRLATTLDAVHEAGIAHHGLHPGNVLLTEDGGVELVDFDLATLMADVRPGFTHHREILGPLPYLSPEQTGRTGSVVDRRADLYAVGAVLYEAACGRRPFVQDDAFELVREILTRTPMPIIELDPTLPPALDAVLARLLEKEPERRYQSAAGLAHDLARIAADAATTFALGERDFPDRLSPPSQLVGRTTEIAILAAALDAVADPTDRSGGAALAGGVLLVRGPPGVGKSTLVNTLRPLVTQRGGWFVSGKADQVVHDSTAGLRGALRGLARLLLAEPSAALEFQSRELRRRLRSNATVLVAMAPEFAQVFGEPTVAGDLDDRELEDRTRQAVIDLLRVVASPRRPVVLVLDDLQWAPPGALDMLDAIAHAPLVDGLLLVATYRDTEPDSRLARIVAGWEQLGVGPRTVRLAPLEVDDLATLLEHMLRLPAAPAAVLAVIVRERTGGNPFDTIELLNSLREHGALVLGEDGWTWDADVVRDHVGHSDVVALLTDRIDKLGPDAVDVLGAMSCLGAEVSGTDLAIACGLPIGQLVIHLTKPLASGLVTPVRNGRPTLDPVGQLRFRHGRVQQAAFERFGSDQRRSFQVQMGWRLATAGRDLLAARLLLAADVRPRDRAEGQLVVRLYRTAADDERRRTEFTATEQFLAAAARILRDEPTAAREHFAVESERHQALYQMGRLDEADSVYESLRGATRDAMELAQVTATQVASLTNRQLSADAVDLGLRVLARLGMTFPEHDAAAEVARGLTEVVAWTKQLDAKLDAARPAVTDPTIAAVVAVMDRLSPAAFFAAPLVSGWLVTQAKRLWEMHGPSSDLMAVLGHGSTAFIAVLDEYRAGQRLLTHVIAVGETYGWERAVANTQFLYAVTSAHWFEPLEECVATAKHARDGLLHVGDLPQAGWASFPLVVDTFETAPHLDEVLAELATALALADRTANVPVQRCFSILRQFCHEIRGSSDAATSRPKSDADGPTVEALAEVVPIIGAYLWLFRSIAAALTGKWKILQANSRAAHQKTQHLPGIVITQMVSVPFGLDLSLQLRHRQPGEPEHAALLAELDEVLAWLRRRAQDQPENSIHLVSYLEAERAWALGDHDGALARFDSALSQLERVSRPWHRALIARRAGEMHRERGLEHSGRMLLAEARQALVDWGADAVVTDLDRTYPFLRDRFVVRPGIAAGSFSARTLLTADTMDTTAILRVAQALASQTTMPELHGAIVEQLRAITGATAVQVVLFDESIGWRIYRAATDTASDTGLDESGAAMLVPVSAVRYVLRTGEALAVDDATADDRFARDPYLEGEERLALLVVPVLRGGAPRAVLVLENRLTSGAFTTDRLGFVDMLTGQLAVALDNAQLYTSLERRIAERTVALRSANDQLELLSTTDALTGVANRRRFDMALAAEWTRSLGTAEPITLIMADVDHFKQYNDDYGHLAGDACLVEISRLLTDSARDTDLLCRYGGEEFAAILPRADLEAAVAVAERMRRAVAGARLPHTLSGGMVTVSVGVASTIASTKSQRSELLANADAALYEAKHAGRNCVRTRVS